MKKRILKQPECCRGMLIRFISMLFVLLMFLQPLKVRAEESTSQETERETAAQSVVRAEAPPEEGLSMELTYGYQDTAKAGRFLPLRITIQNSGRQTFSGSLHIYLAENETSLYEYAYPLTVEGESGRTMSLNVALSSGINQLLVTAVSNQGEQVFSKRVGLDVSSSEAELIIGVLSETPERLSYLNGVGIYEGLLRSSVVNLDANALPQEQAELDQLDVLMISNFDLQQLEQTEADVIRSWVESGGVLLIGTGARGDMALQPYFGDVLAETLQPELMQVELQAAEEENPAAVLELNASAVHLQDGRDIYLSGEIPVLSKVNYGSGILAVCGYDFCDVAAYAADQLSYTDQLFQAVLGQDRMETLSVPASERGLNEYWDIQELMWISDISKLPNFLMYAVALTAYVLLIGPGLYFFLRERHLSRIYMPSALLCAGLGVLLIWIMGINTRFNGNFLTYARIRTVSQESIQETDFINLRSPYSEPYELEIRPEYYVYPVLKGSSYSGDLSELTQNEEIAHTTIDAEAGQTTIRMEQVSSFTPRYFQLTNNIPNTDGSFTAELNIFEGTVSGTIRNQSIYSLTDAALILYGRLIYLGRLDAGATLDISNLETEVIPVGSHEMIAERITTGSRLNVLTYYLKNNVNGYFSNARLVGFVRDNQLSFTSQNIDSFGTTMIVSSIPVNREQAGQQSFSVLSRDPRVISGDYNLAENTISGSVPTVIEYSLGEETELIRLRLEALQIKADTETNALDKIIPFRGSISIYNYETGSFESVKTGSSWTAEEMQPYLSERNTFQLRYTPGGEDRLAREQYLPMPEATAAVR